MNMLLRILANAIWALAFGLSVWLAVEHHGYVFDIALGVSVLSLMLSGLGLLFARYCGRDGDRLAMSIGVIIWLAGAMAFAVTEFGYWASSYKEKHSVYVQSKAVQVRQDGLKDNAWEALKTGEIRATSAELQSRIKAAQQSDIWLVTRRCTAATTPATRQFCREYFELDASVARAAKLEAIEAGFMAEKPDEKQKLANRVFAAADLIAENTNLSERQAATMVIFIVAALLMVARDLLPIVANPLRKRKEALQPAKATETPAVATPAIYEAPAQDDALSPERIAKAEEWIARLRETHEKMRLAGEKHGGLLHQLSDDQLRAIFTYDGPEYLGPAEIGPNSPNSDHVRDATKKVEQQIAESAKSPTLSNVENEPNHPESPVSLEASGEIIPLALAGDEPDVIEAVMTKEAANVYDLLTGMPKPMPLEHAFGADVKIRREKPELKDFVRECLDIDREALVAMKSAIRDHRALDRTASERLMSSPDCYDIYVNWCDANGLTAKGSKGFSGDLWDFVGLPKGTRKMKGVTGLRNAAGLRFPVAEKVRKIAAA